MFSHCNVSLYGDHKDEINSLVFSLDFEILLTGSINGCIRIWNTVNNHLTLTIEEYSGRIRGLAISNNDKYFASIANDIDVRLYETRTGSLVHLLSGHTYVSDCLQFSSDNQFLASGAWDCRTILWNIITGEQIYNFHHHTDAVQSIAFHPSRNIMVTGSYDRNIFFYDLEKPLPLKLHGHFNNIRALTFSHLPYLASAGYDKIIIIWQIEKMKIYHHLFGHTGWIQAMSFRDNDGSILASVDDDTVHVWNIISGLCLHRLSIVNDLSCCIRFLPNDSGLLVGGAVYELLIDQQMSPNAKRVYEPITGEIKLLPLPKEKSFKLRKLKSKRTYTK